MSILALNITFSRLNLKLCKRVSVIALRSWGQTWKWVALPCQEDSIYAGPHQCPILDWPTLRDSGAVSGFSQGLETLVPSQHC